MTTRDYAPQPGDCCGCGNRDLTGLWWRSGYVVGSGYVVACSHACLVDTLREIDDDDDRAARADWWA